MKSTITLTQDELDTYWKVEPVIRNIIESMDENKNIDYIIDADYGTKKSLILIAGTIAAFLKKKQPLDKEFGYNSTKFMMEQLFPDEDHSSVTREQFDSYIPELKGTTS